MDKSFNNNVLLFLKDSSNLKRRRKEIVGKIETIVPMRESSGFMVSSRSKLDLQLKAKVEQRQKHELTQEKDEHLGPILIGS